VRLLGIGGYGEVYLCKWHSADVAVKCLNPNLLTPDGGMGSVAHVSGLEVQKGQGQGQVDTGVNCLAVLMHGTSSCAPGWCCARKQLQQVDQHLFAVPACLYTPCINQQIFLVLL
jgi:serine/threonine protein kinase